MLDPGKPSFTPKKGKTSVVMFVGLQGNWCFRLLWYDLGSKPFSCSSALKMSM